MPDRTISILSISCAALVAVYIGLVVVTISFAAWQTDLAGTERATESHIAELEDQYYATMARLSAMDPASEGLTLPAHVHYAVAASAPTLTLR